MTVYTVALTHWGLTMQAKSISTALLTPYVSRDSVGNKVLKNMDGHDWARNQYV